jgi:hypothetical protein
MGTKTSQAQGLRVWLLVDQQQVRPNVALTIARPIAAQFMVAVSWLQWDIVCQGNKN